tara:strand:- start:67 stop:237 length:171 start_codon:yes stop_codon:yes gene_type:complete
MCRKEGGEVRGRLLHLVQPIGQERVLRGKEASLKEALEVLSFSGGPEGSQPIRADV